MQETLKKIIEQQGEFYEDSGEDDDQEEGTVEDDLSNSN